MLTFPLSVFRFILFYLLRTERRDRQTSQPTRRLCRRVYPTGSLTFSNQWCNTQNNYTNPQVSFRTCKRGFYSDFVMLTASTKSLHTLFPLRSSHHTLPQQPFKIQHGHSTALSVRNEAFSRCPNTGKLQKKTILCCRNKNRRRNASIHPGK